MNILAHRRLVMKFVLVSTIFLFANASFGWADLSPQAVEELVKSNKELVAKVSSLDSTVHVLEGRLAQVESAPRTVSAAPVAGEGGVVRTVGNDIKLSGFVDTSFNWNFTNPPPKATPGDTLGNGANRAFDRNSNTFNLNNLQLNIERPAPEKGGVGFNTQIDYGTDAQIIESAGFLGGGTGAGSTDEVSIQEAYAILNAPIGSGLTVWAGKFATLHGAEVIENYQNWNASRSLLFNLAIPFTHTGMRAFYNWFGGKLNTAVGLVNGWDQAVDVNNVKDVEAMVTWTPNENFSARENFMIGSQVAGDRGTPRGILDTVVTWTPLPKDLPKLKLMANYDYGWDKGVAKPRAESGTPDWQGYALYAKYDVNDWLTTAVRWEQFWDDTGVRTGIVAGDDFYEMTYTADVKLYKDLLTRFEYRHDFAKDSKSFDNSRSPNQDTVGVSLIYLFA